MKTYIGQPIPDDMFTFFAELTAYKCLLCNSIVASGVYETEGTDTVRIVVDCCSVVDDYARPLGLVCKECRPHFSDYVYRRETK